jgi:TPP-dependent pyruvate/acetoin dehydrogenase alpha subunit
MSLTLSKFEPGTREEALQILRKLVLIRRCQERICEEYPKDEMKTPVHLGIGLEGISVGVAHVLPPGSRSFGQLRNHGQYLALTGETDAYFGELYGRVTGTAHGKSGSMHLCAPEAGLITTSGIVASTIPLAVGAAFAAKYQKSSGVAVAMFGDGAMEEGEFWESLNFACLHRLPVLFVCEDNDLAIHTFAHERRGYGSPTEPIRGFRCHVFEGDGIDVLKVADLVQQALDAMVREPGPAFVSFRYHRYIEHTGTNSDYHVGYRPQPTEEELRAWDPLLNYERYLADRGIEGAGVEAVRTEVDAQIERSIAAAKAAPFPGRDDLFANVYA